MNSTNVCDSATHHIWIAGDYNQARELCKKFCEDGMCVSLTPVDFIYTGGEQSGIKVTLINYARFPCELEEIRNKAIHLGELLMIGLHQISFSVEGPKETVYFSTK